MGKNTGSIKIDEIDEDLLHHVAEVARLNISPEEIRKFTPQLKDIITVFSKIKEVDTDDVKPSFQPVQLKNALREDEPEECLTQEQALMNSKHCKDGYFKGPKAV